MRFISLLSPEKKKLSLSARICFYVLLFFGIVALLAPVIANHKPWYVSFNGQSFFPAFSTKGNILIQNQIIDFENTDWKNFECDKIIFAPVPWSPSKPDYVNADYASPSQENFFKDKYGNIEKSPARFRHLLGTDKLGRDVLSGMIHGTRISFFVGIFSMLIASVIGISLGAIAGYFGDYSLKISIGAALLLITGIIPAWFYGFEMRSFILHENLQHSAFSFIAQLTLSLIIFLAVLLFFTAAGKLLGRFLFFRKKIFVRADGIISRMFEILSSLPQLVLIITIAAIAKPSFTNLVFIIGFTAWTDIARLTRAEFIRLRETEFIESARALGYSNLRIIFRHALPNGIAPAIVAIAFGAASAVLAESALSFLGAGVPQNVVTWGSMLAQGKENMNAWWLVVFPGFAIFVLVTVYNLLADTVRDALGGK